jgi:16S rRNA (cytidine1402-2'-O)-methyltransferase
VVAEDTRRTGRLLVSIGVRTKLRSFFDGNERERTPTIVRELVEGRSVALVSDGGMPLVSDPGYRLVTASIGAGIEVRVVPGPSSVLAALVVSGLPTDRFAFEGFLPRPAGERRARAFRRSRASRPHPRLLRVAAACARDAPRCDRDAGRSAGGAVPRADEAP